MGKKQYDLSSIDGLEKVFNDSVKEMAEEVLFQIEGCYESAIEAFYNDYNPLYYQRTLATYEGSSGAIDLFSPQNLSESGGVYSAGIQVDPSFIKGKPYRADTEWVFQRTYNQGIHGQKAGMIYGKKRNKKFMRVYARPDLFVIKMVGDKTTLRRQHYKNMTVTRRGKYFYDIKKLGEWTPMYREVVMNNMSPTPRGLVGKEFRKLTKKKNMKQMFANILERNIM